MLIIGKPTIKSMYLNNRYRKAYSHNFGRMLDDKTDGKIWDTLTNAEKAYVLKGGRNNRRF